MAKFILYLKMCNNLTMAEMDIVKKYYIKTLKLAVKVKWLLYLVKLVNVKIKTVLIKWWILVYKS